MSDINIPANVWKEFLDKFSKRHAGWLVQVETYDRKTEEFVTSQLSVLHSMELDVEDEQNPRINVIVLYDSKELKHILFRPSQVTLRISEKDGEDSLCITSVNADTTIRLRGSKAFDVLDLIKTLNVLEVVRDEAA